MRDEGVVTLGVVEVFAQTEELVDPESHESVDRGNQNGEAPWEPTDNGYGLREDALNQQRRNDNDQDAECDHEKRTEVHLALLSLLRAAIRPQLGTSDIYYITLMHNNQ